MNIFFINDSGIAELARRLANDRRIDRTDLILRKSTISKLSTGGSRKQNLLRDSLMLNTNLRIKDDIILLVDDITTSGNSLKVCRNLLLENGAKNVAMFALGKTIRDDGSDGNEITS